MNASCIICSDLFSPRSEIFTTACGHLFHQDCLKQWIERSRTCPQCRHKETLSTIRRIYLNFASAEGIADDVNTLQSKLDAVLFQISIKDKEIAKFSDKYMACEAKCTRMREVIVELEQAQRTHDSSMLALESQVKTYREKVKDNNELLANIERLKVQIESMEYLKSVISNCESQVNQMLSLNNDPESLSILVVTLKRQLEETKKRNQDMSSRIYRIGKEILNTNSTMEKMKARNAKMEEDLVAHENCASEINYLGEKIKNAKRGAWLSSNSTTTSASASSTNSLQGSESTISCDSASASPSIAPRQFPYATELPSTSGGGGSSSSRPNFAKIGQQSQWASASSDSDSEPNSKSTQTSSSHSTNKRAREITPTSHFAKIGQRNQWASTSSSQSDSDSGPNSKYTQTSNSQPTNKWPSEVGSIGGTCQGSKRALPPSSYTTASKFRKLAPRNPRKPT